MYVRFDSDLLERANSGAKQWKDAVQTRGFTHLRVIGRLLTRQEEKNDVRLPFSFLSSIAPFPNCLPASLI